MVISSFHNSKGFLKVRTDCDSARMNKMDEYIQNACNRSCDSNRIKRTAFRTESTEELLNTIQHNQARDQTEDQT